MALLDIVVSSAFARYFEHHLNTFHRHSHHQHDAVRDKTVSGFPFSFAKSFTREDKGGVCDSEPNLQVRINQITAKSPSPRADAVHAIETRRANRLVPAVRTIFITAKDGKKYPAHIIDVSRTGVLLETDFAHPEDVILVGATRVTYARPSRSGAAFSFKTPLSFQACNREIIL